MIYPTLYARKRTQDTLDVFAGYNHNVRIPEGEFFDMKNLTSDLYPVLSPRKPRGLYLQGANVQGMTAKDSLCYVDGSDFVINGHPVAMGLSTEAEDCPKQLVSMGAYVIILPDKKYINTADITDHGNIEAEVTTTAPVSFALSREDGGDCIVEYIQAEEPTEPENTALWVDTSSTPHSLQQWSESAGMWVAVESTYVKISSAGIGKSFKEYDGVTISGLKDKPLTDSVSGTEIPDATDLAALEGSNVIWSKGDDYIVVAGMLDMTRTISDPVTIARKMPKMDFIIESENRLWGCRYGLNNDGVFVNELYCCKLGDFRNWSCYMGVSTDSYAASLGTDGQFTGAITYGGHPLFWKENFLHAVYGQIPANFQIQTTACRGVQKGSERSLAIVGEILYYKARHAVCGYDGSLPTEVSAALGEERYRNAVACAHGNKYYISMEKSDGTSQVLMVLDTAKGMWHKEDDLRAYLFCSCRDELYCATEDGKILTMLGSGEGYEDRVEWMAETGIIGGSLPDSKYLVRLNIRMVLEMDSHATILVQYDSAEDWEELGFLTGTDLRSFTIPVRPRRCDHLRLRIEADGKGMVFSITKTLTQGSDIT